MKKVLALTMALALVAASFAGCGNSSSSTSTTAAATTAAAGETAAAQIPVGPHRAGSPRLPWQCGPPRGQCPTDGSGP